MEKATATKKAKKSYPKNQTVAQFIESLGAEMKIENTVSKKVLGATVTKRFRKNIPGFNTHGMQVNQERVPVWAKAKLDDREYIILFYQPKGEGKAKKPAKTYYKMVTPTESAESAE